ncbi:hypothetical protein NIES2109_55670 (plasmid) [Nostoc sp. HK-01]|nr:hypothetical protein NIES2109_55670 [Nostoc sp. HK-01]
MPDSEGSNKVTNNDLPNSQFGGGLINAESVKAERIGGDIYNIYLGHPPVASNPTPSLNQQQRSLLSYNPMIESGYFDRSIKYDVNRIIEYAPRTQPR